MNKLRFYFLCVLMAMTLLMNGEANTNVESTMLLEQVTDGYVGDEWVEPNGWTDPIDE